jgi:hypothetical protein
MMLARSAIAKIKRICVVAALAAASTDFKAGA